MNHHGPPPVSSRAMIERHAGVVEHLCARPGDGMRIAAKQADTPAAQAHLQNEWTAREALRVVLGERGPEALGLLRRRKALTAQASQRGTSAVVAVSRPLEPFACEVVPEQSVQAMVLAGKPLSESDAVCALDTALQVIAACRAANVAPPDLTGDTLYWLGHRAVVDAPGTGDWESLPRVFCDLARGLGGGEPSATYREWLDELATVTRGAAGSALDPHALRATLHRYYGRTLASRLSQAELSALARADVPGGTHRCPGCATEYVASIAVCERCNLSLPVGNPLTAYPATKPSTRRQQRQRQRRVHKFRAAAWVGWTGLFALLALLSATFGFGWVAASVLLGISVVMLLLFLAVLQ